MHGKIKSYLTDNWILKLVSLFIALILWFTLIPEEKTFQEKTLSVRLEIHNIPSHLELVERPPQYIDVTVRAPTRLIPQISSANVYGILDLQRDTGSTKRQYCPELIFSKQKYGKYPGRI